MKKGGDVSRKACMGLSEQLGLVGVKWEAHNDGK